MNIFYDEDDYHAYLGFLATCIEEYQVSLYHYVLMPNHVHLLVRPAVGLSAFMQRIQTSYAKSYCRKRKFVGHVWQGRFKSLPVMTDAYLFACGNYIEMNPVRARLVSLPQKWHYSSYRTYAFGEKNPLVTIDPFYASLGATLEERQQKYRETITATRI